MKTKGALLWELNSPFRIDEIEIGDPVDDEVQMDLTFRTPGTAFGDILSLVPAIYARDFESVQTSGTMSVSGEVKGEYGPGVFEQPWFSAADVPAALAAAASVGVDRIVQVAYDLETAHWSVATARQHRQVKAAVALLAQRYPEDSAAVLNDLRGLSASFATAPARFTKVRSLPRSSGMRKMITAARKLVMRVRTGSQAVMAVPPRPREGFRPG